MGADRPDPERPPPAHSRDEPRPDLHRRLRGSLLAGALGDALGAPIEFLSLAEIRSRYPEGGPRGLDRLAPAYGRLGAITDDTQMTLFTAEGLIRAWVRGKSRGIGHPPAVVHHAYLRWLHTQGVPWRKVAGTFASGHSEPDGWLVGERFLHARRAPGNTCLAALTEDPNIGQPARNDSKGCGGVMRVAPVGFLEDAGTGSEPTPAEGLFRLAVEIAALTHGHPTGQLPAGVLAATIHGLVTTRRPLARELDEAIAILRRWPHHHETLAALDTALELADQPGPATPERVESLGGGWVAEEALAIAVYCALAHPDDLRSALVLAANHSGDSDSTAAICGNLLGAALGEEALPEDWLELLEGRETIERLADDLHAEITDTRPQESWSGATPEQKAALEEWWERYPGW